MAEDIWPTADEVGTKRASLFRRIFCWFGFHSWVLLAPYVWHGAHRKCDKCAREEKYEAAWIGRGEWSKWSE